jgi:hypothetical protein
MYDAQGNMTRQWVLYFAQLPGAGSGAGSPPVPLTADGSGTATPDLSQGTLFILVLTADTTLALPANGPGADSAAIAWTLIAQQDGTGGHSLITTDYHMNYTLSTAQSPPSTECGQGFSTDATATRVLGAPSIDQPIP